MNTRGLLDQLLKSGQDLLKQHAGKTPGASSGSGSGSGLGGLLSGMGSGALGAGALGALLGNKRTRKAGGKAVSYGGLAALGMLAYKAYGAWQANQANANQANQANQAYQANPNQAPQADSTSSANAAFASHSANPITNLSREPQTLDRVPADQAEQHCQAVLQALVAAAKADGHVDERERALIEGELSRLDSDPELRQWLQAELAKPLDPTEVAQAAKTPEMAAEMFLASLMMVDEENFMERAYLDELARQLSLDPGLRQELESQARLAGAQQAG
ncbi:tellurite resistance TerB family protein [Pseudomonas sp. RP23018S]|uniref:tellurite resistance TerB family protein n=1 Tax=Pseudomonas sp. RP23018S TaxID=3096037 RepID=UPI002ACA00F1|nr:tellurite resistance TerB family protein [Pseudomonas sp. RP23018S]MDZ5603514.1 tellurite resistance TerB family protein [Pseudomonas sp. RP23018S]